MTKTTKLIKQDDGVYRIEIPEDYISKLGWRNGHILEIDSTDEKLVIEKLEDEITVNYNAELPDGLYYIEHKIVKDFTSGGIVGCAIFNK